MGFQSRLVSWFNQEKMKQQQRPGNISDKPKSSPPLSASPLLPSDSRVLIASHSRPSGLALSGTQSLSPTECDLQQTMSFNASPSPPQGASQAKREKPPLISQHSSVHFLYLKVRQRLVLSQPDVCGMWGTRIQRDPLSPEGRLPPNPGYRFVKFCAYVSTIT